MSLDFYPDDPYYSVAICGWLCYYIARGCYSLSELNAYVRHHCNLRP